MVALVVRSARGSGTARVTQEALAAPQPPQHLGRLQGDTGRLREHFDTLGRHITNAKNKYDETATSLARLEGKIEDVAGRGGLPRRIFEFDDPESRIDYPVWSPDGRWILFDRFQPYGGDVWAVEG